MRYVVWTLAVALAIFHQDLWWWGDTTLVWGGRVPIGLAYHAGFSVAAAAVWALAVKFAWPTHIEKWADEFEGADPAAAEHGEGDD